MSSNMYGLSSLNLALDGSLDLFYELYINTYDLFYEKVNEDHSLILNRDRLNAIILPEIIPSFELLAFRRLRIFTKKIKNIHLYERHFKRFSFFDEVEITRIKSHTAWELEWEWATKWGKYFEEKYRTTEFTQNQKQRAEQEILSKFQDLFISFEQFIGEFQRIVIRAIHETIQNEDPNYTIFDARKDVEDHISHRMINKRNECIMPTSTSLPPTKEPLYVFNALNSTSCKKNNHRIVLKKYYALHSDGKNTVVLPVHYCAECNRYMIGSLSLSYFRDFCGKFIVQTHMLISDYDNSWDLVRESKLHQLGYNVIEGKLSSLERQNILISLLKGKYISFFEMVSSIEQNIRMFRNHYKMQRAVEKWRADLAFINEFMVNNKEYR